MVPIKSTDSAVSARRLGLACGSPTQFPDEILQLIVGDIGVPPR
jgi:hypothetical protein